MEYLKVKNSRKEEKIEGVVETALLKNVKCRFGAQISQYSILMIACKAPVL